MTTESLMQSLLSACRAYISSYHKCYLAQALRIYDWNSRTEHENLTISHEVVDCMNLSFRAFQDRVRKVDDNRTHLLPTARLAL